MFDSQTVLTCRAILRRLAHAKPIYLAAAIMLSGVSANADTISTFASPIGGFVANSALAAGAAGASYLAAQGSPTEFLSFSTDKNGNPVNGLSVSVAGNIFSNFVTFSSGGSSSVQLGLGNSSASEIGPVGLFTGQLNIQFLNPVFAVAFGAVDPFTYVAFDSHGNILTSGTTGAHIFDFLGLVDKSGSNIARLRLYGTFYAIQDLQYGIADPPTTASEPSSLLMLGLGLTTIGILFRRRKTVA